MNRLQKFTRVFVPGILRGANIEVKDDQTGRTYRYPRTAAVVTNKKPGLLGISLGKEGPRNKFDFVTFPDGRHVRTTKAIRVHPVKLYAAA